MTIEVLFSEGCPGFAELLPRVSELADSLGAALLVRSPPEAWLRAALRAPGQSS